MACSASPRATLGGGPPPFLPRSGSSAIAICVPSVDVVYAAGDASCSVADSFHIPPPRGTMVWYCLWRLVSVSNRWSVAGCACMVEQGLGDAGSRSASCSILAALVSSMALCRPSCFVSVNGKSLTVWRPTRTMPSAAGPSSMTVLRCAGTLTCTICSNCPLSGCIAQTMATAGYSPRTAYSAAATA